MALDKLIASKSGPLVVKIDELVKEQRKANKLLEKILKELKNAD